MSKVGGYKIIDLENKKLTNDVGMVYEGIYDKIESTRKPILISGLNIDGKEYHDFFATLYKVGIVYMIDIHEHAGGDGLKSLSINDNDVVTITIV